MSDDIFESFVFIGCLNEVEPYQRDFAVAVRHLQMACQFISALGETDGDVGLRKSAFRQGDHRDCDVARAHRTHAVDHENTVQSELQGIRQNAPFHTQILQREQYRAVMVCRQVSGEAPLQFLIDQYLAEAHKDGDGARAFAVQDTGREVGAVTGGGDQFKDLEPFFRRGFDGAAAIQHRLDRLAGNAGQRRNIFHGHFGLFVSHFSPHYSPANRSQNLLRFLFKSRCPVKIHF